MTRAEPHRRAAFDAVIFAMDGVLTRTARLHAQAEAGGVDVFASTVTLIEALRDAGVRVGVVTSSRQGREILARTGTELLFDARIDGIDVAERALRGKPAVFQACAADLGVTPARSIVVEEAAAGIAAARKGGFGLAIGVDRGGNRDALEHHGAHVVVEDLGGLDIAELDRRFVAEREQRCWRIEQEGFDPAREHGVESLFTVGNGYLGVRGALDTPVPLSQGDLLIAGVYDRRQTARSYAASKAEDAEHEYPYTDIVSFPFPFPVRISLADTPLSLTNPSWRTHRRVLDMKKGLLQVETTYECEPGLVVRTTSRRCASLDDVHILLQEFSVQLENFSSIIEIDASIADADLAARHPHLVPRAARTNDPTIEVHCFTTRASRIEACIAQRTTLVGSGEHRTRWRLSAEIGRTLQFRRYVAVYTSRDVADPEAAAVEAVRAQPWERFERALGAHTERWRRVWDRADIVVRGHPAAQQALRFLAYHLSIAADGDPRVSVGARTLSGTGYQGHVFWDVEVFMLPFYLHTAPDVARCLLSYRHHTLDGARRRARQLGRRGACYAWESTTTGDDVTPRVAAVTHEGEEIPLFTGTQQIHVTADVAYAVWRYWEATGDEAFLRDEGAEILAETARFWASRVDLDEGSYHIRRVMGPDEYHHDTNDNAYTNWMARFNLERAAWSIGWLKAEHPKQWGELAERIGLDDYEPDEWSAIAHRLYVPQPREDGVIEQFEGFFDLEDYPLKEERHLDEPLDRLFDLEKINGMKLIKQADVLMLPFLFPECFDERTLAANYAYYEPITDHRSSLSPGVHAALAARLGLEDDAQRYWQESLMLDLNDTMSNSALGVHAACMGGTWQALVFHILGVRFVDGRAVVDPRAHDRLPDGWRSVALHLLWRGRSHRVEVTR